MTRIYAGKTVLATSYCRGIKDLVVKSKESARMELVRGAWQIGCQDAMLLPYR